MSPDDWVRITRYLDGEATPDERRETEHWLDADPARRAVLDDARRLHASARAGRATDSHQGAAQADWEAVRRRTATPDRPASRRPLRDRRRASLVRAAVAVAVVLGSVWAGLAYEGRSPAPPPAAEIWTAGPTQNATLSLADGTRIRLASRTVLTQPDPTVRRFVLSGVARFEVARDPERPFVVETPHGSTRVLGTTFTVRARLGDEATTVAVEEGRVAVRSARADGEVVLGAGEFARARSGVRPVRLGTAPPPDIAGVPDVASGPEPAPLRFDGARLATVAAALSDAHGVRVVVRDAALAERAVSADLTGLTLDESLEVLGAVLDLDAVVEGGRVSLVPSDLEPQQ